MEELRELVLEMANIFLSLGMFGDGVKRARAIGLMQSVKEADLAGKRTRIEEIKIEAMPDEKKKSIKVEKKIKKA
jgi:hypothetical protein